MVVCLTIYQVHATLPEKVACSLSAVANCIVTPVPHCPVMVALTGETPSNVKSLSNPANPTPPPDNSAHVCSKANLPRKMVISYQNYLSEDNLLKLIIINKWRSEGIMR
jgi:hypothetical protein